MTNEIEKKFFDTFGIEAKYKCTKDGNCYFQECSKCDWYIHTYPQINDRVLLELICIVLNTFETFEVYRIMDIDSLKEKILKLSMLAKDDVYSQVRTLFEEG